MFTSKRSFLLVITLLVGILLLLSACTATPVPATPTPTTGPCAFVWASYDLEESSLKLQAALDAAGLENITGNASVFGENCVNEDGSIESFAARDVDIYLSIAVDSLLDTASMGEQAMGAVEVLMALPADTFPNTINFVNFQFTDGGNVFYVQQSYAGLVVLVESQPTGQEFYKSIQQPAPF